MSLMAHGINDCLQAWRIGDLLQGNRSSQASARTGCRQAGDSLGLTCMRNTTIIMGRERNLK